MDETWLYHWPGDKATINGSGGIAAHPIPKNSECKNPLEKFSPQFFGLKTASSSMIIFKTATIKAEYYSSLPVQMKDILKEKRHRKVTKEVMFLHNNAPAHQALATQKKPASLGFHCLDHPPYSPDLAPSDYYLFPGLKKTIDSSCMCSFEYFPGIKL